MKTILPRKHPARAMRRLALAALIAGCGTCLQAQTAPTDAGRILRDEQARGLPAAPPVRLDIPLKIDEPSTGKVAPGGPRVLVKSFRFIGNNSIGSEMLGLVLVDAAGQELDLAGLRALADRITVIFRAEGHPFCQAFLPKQEIKEGVVVIEIVEGRYGKVAVTGEPGIGQTLQGYLGTLKSGELIKEDDLQQTLLVMTEIPGVKISPVFSPGAAQGASDLNVVVTAGQAWQAYVKVDNYGGRYSGQYRAQIAAERAGIFRVGDKVALNALVTDESLLLGGAKYDFPLGFSGLRAHVGYSRTDYQLGAGFEGFTGLADAWTAGLSYPLKRSQKTNLTLSFEAEYKKLQDQNLGATYENRDAVLAAAGLQFDTRDAAFGGGVTYGELKVAAGNISSDVAASIQGGFSKVNAQVARLQNAGSGFVVYGSLSAQAADRALNSSESFALGGATGVRSYPNGEAQGTGGMLAQVELRYEIGTVTPYLFYDQGDIFAQDGQPSRSLGGVGLGARYRAGSLSAEAACAWKTNGGAATSDSKQQDPRLWLSMGYRY